VSATLVREYAEALPAPQAGRQNREDRNISLNLSYFNLLTVNLMSDPGGFAAVPGGADSK
jgi:hypothetical protein